MKRIRRSPWTDRSGAAALEFALLVPFFFALVFSTLEAGWIMTKAMMLDRAVDLTVRQIRIGATDAPTTQEAIRTAICARAAILLDCRNSLLVEMIEIDSPADFPDDTARCIDRSGTVAPIIRYSQGERSEVMYIRACVVTDPLTPLIGLALALPKDATGGFSLVSASAFMNEP